MSDLQLTLLTPTQKLAFNLPIESLQAVATQGEIEVLKDHAPLLTTLGVGLLKYKQKRQSFVHKVAIFWGYLEVFNNTVNVLAETAEVPENIDKKRAMRALKEATDAMEKGKNFESNALKAQKARLRLALVEDKKLEN